jgi:CRISPR-associated protein Csd1
LILGGAKGRSAIRAYGRQTTSAVAQAVSRYISHARIQRPYGKGEGVYPLRVYLRSLAALGDEKNLPPQLAGDLYMAILEGRPFPMMVLDTAIRRARLEAPRMNDKDPRKKAEANEAFAARCGLIRAYFHRQPEHPKEITVSLDPNCREVGYVLGRLFAVLDKAQSLAIKNANATIVDRFYGTASTAPAAVFPTLLQKAQQHLGKLRGDKERPWAFPIVDTALSDVTELLEAKPIPKVLDLSSQGLFALGFHHQRQDFFTKKDDSSNS